MEKIYQEPKIKVVKVSHHQTLCSSPWTDPNVDHLGITEDSEDALPPI